MFNAEEYTVSVRREMMDGESYWVARVEELPDILEFGQTRSEAYDLAIDTIITGHEMCLSKGISFPPPKKFEEHQTSGRVTLRLPKSLHQRCISESEKEGVSINTYIVTCIASYQQVSYKTISDEIINLVRSGIANNTGVSMQTHSYKAGYEFALRRQGHISVQLSKKELIDADSSSTSTLEEVNDIISSAWSTKFSLC